MRTICEGEGRFGQFLPGPNEAHDYEPQAYSHPGVSFDGHGVYCLVRCPWGPVNTSVEISDQPEAKHYGTFSRWLGLGRCARSVSGRPYLPPVATATGPTGDASTTKYARQYAANFRFT